VTHISHTQQKYKTTLRDSRAFSRLLTFLGGRGYRVTKNLKGKPADEEISTAAIKVYGLKLGGAGLAYLMQVALAQLLGAASYGVFALAWVIASTLGQISCCGFNETANRFLPGYISAGDLPRARGFLWFSRKISVLVAIAGSIGIALGIYLAQNVISEIYMWPVLMALASVPILAFTHLQESVAISRSHIIAGLLPTYIMRPIFLIAFTALAVFGLNTGHALSAIYAFLLAGLAAAALQFLLLSKPIKNEFATGEIVVEPRFWLTSSVPLFMSQGFFILATSIDVFILSFFVSAGELGIYFAAAKTVGVISFVYIAVGMAIARRLSESSASGDKVAFERHFARGRTWMFLPTLFGSTLLLLVAPILLRIFGPEFVSGATIISILLCGVVAQAAGGPLQEALVVTGQQKAVSVIVGLSILANIVLSIALVIWLGITGAAVASSICVTARVGAMWLTVRRPN